MGLQEIILFIITGLGQFTMDLYLPSMPYLTNYFQVTPVLMQYTLGFFLLFMMLSQLIYGPISDHYGRKRTLGFGISILITGTFLCLIAKIYVVFLLGRCLQGIGIGATSSLCRAIARDLFRGKYLQKISSIMMIIWSISLVVAPLIGGIIQYYLTWRVDFLLLLVMHVFIFLLVCSILKESNHIKIMTNIKIEVNSIFRAYRYCFLNKPFMYNCLICALGACVIYIYNFEAPFLIQIKLTYSAIIYGVVSFLITLGYVLGAFLNLKLIKITETDKLIKLIAFMASGFSLIMLALSYYNQLSLEIISLMFFLTFAVGILISNKMAKAFDGLKEYIGVASSVYGAIVFISGFLCNLIAAYLIRQNFMLFSLLIFILFATIVLLLSKKKMLSHQFSTKLES